jgi:quercetin dioxygenase-like cupin family protein
MNVGRMLSLVLVLVIGIVLGSVGSHMLDAQQTDTKTALLKADLAGVQGEVGYLVMHELAPGAVEEKHYHNGDIYLYMLAGSETIEVAGQPPVSLKAGQAYYIAPKVVVTPKNSSASVPAKFLTFAVVPKGQPVAVPAK